MDLFTISLGIMIFVILWSATGLLGGLTMAWIVKLSLKSISAGDFWVIVGGWFIGIVTGLTISYTALASIAFAEIKLNFLPVVATMIGGLIAGGIGGGVMYRVIDRALAR